MKAIILAAGYAKRLWPLTLEQPKPLLKIGGKPILERIIEKIERVQEIDKIYVITNHKFKPNFDSWLSGYTSKTYIEVLDDKTTSNEDRLGAIGDIYYTIKNKEINEDLLVYAGDTLAEVDLEEMTKMMKQKKASVTAVKQVELSFIAGRLGCVTKNITNKITAFDEKPEKPKSNFVSIPIYLFRKETLPEIKRCIEENLKPDNSGDFIKYLINKKPVYAYTTKGEYFDIGGKEELNKADLKYGGKGKY
jgi:glucose-1-phosphate thymidylyltransferase